MAKNEDMIKISSGKVKKNDSDILRAGDSVISPEVFADMAKTEGSEAKLISKLGKSDDRRKAKA
jgi:hypothetical protein